MESIVKHFVTGAMSFGALSIEAHEELALAMECRCYHGGEGRTRMKQLKMSILDLWGSLFCGVFLAGVIVIDRVLG